MKLLKNNFLCIPHHFLVSFSIGSCRKGCVKSGFLDVQCVTGPIIMKHLVYSNLEHNNKKSSSKIVFQ